MDAPNAPNPANPNAQGQNADAELGPANQAQGPVVLNQAQGLNSSKPSSGSLQIRIKVKSLQVKFQLKVPYRLFKMYLYNHYNNQSLCNQPLMVL